MLTHSHIIWTVHDQQENYAIYGMYDFLFKRCNTFEEIDNRVAIAIMSFFEVVAASESAENIISRLSKRAQT